MEAIGVDQQQKPGDPGDPAKRDNLYEPRSDGTIRGSQNVYVRRTSLLLEAQKQPAALPLALGALGLTLFSQLAERADAARWRARHG
jgi:hypothetical protein